jgi:hypothetical protein
MTKSGTLLTSALLAFGLGAGAVAADMPKTATTTPVAADTAASSDTAKPAKKAKKAKKSKKATAAPTTTK